MKILFVSDTSRHKNWGCKATTSALRSFIDESSHEISDTIYINDIEKIDPQLRAPHPVTIARSFLRLGKYTANGILNTEINRNRVIIPTEWFDSIPTTASEFRPMAEEFLKEDSYHPLVSKIQNSEVVLINGEGSIHGCNRQARCLLFIAFLATKMNKPTYIVNHTLETSDPVTRNMVKVVYPKLNKAVFREPESIKQLPYDLDVDYILAADAAFRFKPTKNKDWTVDRINSLCTKYNDKSYNLDAKEPYVCIGGSSAFRDRPGYNPSSFYINLIEEIKQDIQVVLTVSGESDQSIFQKVSSATNTPLIPVETSFRDAVELLGNSSVYFGGRWHASIFALRGGSSLIPIAGNTHKIHGLIRYINSDQYVFDPTELNNDNVDTIRDTIIKNVYEDYKKDTKEIIREISAKASMNVEVVNS